MLLPWSKASCLSLSTQGIALRVGKQAPQLITEQPFSIADDLALAKVLEQYAGELKGQAVEVVLSNTLVRYCVLPWQAGVYQRDDWEAIAQHAFRKQFGTEASDWLVSVCLRADQSPILAAAIDLSLCTQLQQLSKQIGFNLSAITPLLAKLERKQKPSSQPWLCTVEPQRIVLLQKLAGEAHHVHIDSPPANTESLHLQQLINRVLFQSQQTSNTLEPVVKPLVYVSSALKTSWDERLATACTLAMPLIASQPHPIWMAGL